MAYNRKGTSAEIFNGTETDVLVTPVTLKQNVWFFDGNTMTQERDLGTTNNYDVPIIRNNIEKLRVENATWTTNNYVTTLKIGANNAQSAVRFPLASNIQHGIVTLTGGTLAFIMANGETSGSTVSFNPITITASGNVGINKFAPESNLHVFGTVRHEQTSVLSQYNVHANTDVDTGVTEVVASINATSAFAAFFDYIIYNSTKTNMRAGTIQAVWNTTTVEYQEFSTLDIGDTSDVSFTPTLNAGNLELRAVAATTSNWTVKCISRTIN